MTVFEERLRAAQMPLLTFISTICGVPQEARDILGETNLALIRKRDAYDASRPFLPWARSFAFLTVRCWQRSRRRDRLVCDDDLMERLAEDLSAAPAAETDVFCGADMLRALSEAKKELTPEMRYMLTRRYDYGDSLAAIGYQMNRTAGSVATSLHHIRAVLKASMEKKAREAHEQ